MFFVGWFWMFFELGLFHKVRATWNPDILENASEYATSSDRKGAKWGLFLTIALGILFSFVQAYV